MRGNDFAATVRTYLRGLTGDRRGHAMGNVEKLEAAGVRSFTDLVSMASSREPDQAALACWLIGQLDLKRGSSALAAVFTRSAEPSVFWEAAKALSVLRKGQRSLLRCLQQEVDHRKMEAGAWALGMMGHAEAAPILLGLLEQPALPDFLTAQAAEALGMLQAPDALDALIAKIEDPSPEVRFWSAYALGEIGDTKAVPTLKKAAADDVGVARFGPVAAEARNALQRIRRPVPGRAGNNRRR